MRTLSEIQAEVHALAVEKGWYEDAPEATDPVWLAARLANVHGEVSEALECVRDGDMHVSVGVTGKPCGLPTELADIVIRTCDLAGSLGIDLEAAVRQKHEFNKTRPHKHGKRV